MVEKSLKEIDLKKMVSGKKFHPSPDAWEDLVLYFMMLDRFSDGNETGYFDNAGTPVTSGKTPACRDSDKGNAVTNDADAASWRDAGGRWVGGKLTGLQSKIGYLKRLGVNAVWISPVFKQVSFQPTYHGYGIQHFLDVDPHFGTRDDLKKLVRIAHENKILVILDIILNHTGNVFSYNADRYKVMDANGKSSMDPRWDGGRYAVAGFNDKSGAPSIPFAPIDVSANPDAWPNGALWPSEFQDPTVFTCKGRISSWDNDPEYLEGDFCDLKDVSHGHGDVDAYETSAALDYLCEVYKFWIAFADIDGYRIDTVKHMDLGATRYFASGIHEFAQSIGKENFYLIGEITGGRKRAFTTLDVTGLDAALGVDDIPDKLEYLIKGTRDPSEYFGLFRNSLLINKESHVWFRNKVVTMFDDHDQVRKGENKARFCADAGSDKLVLCALALNTATMGIPCLYYGTEQCFDGHGNNDRYLREAMFGGEFGAFASKDRHFFNEQTWVYREMAKILAIRSKKIALRRGRQYLREISGNGTNFGIPHMINGQIRSVIPWSRIFDTSEIVCAINNDCDRPLSAWVTVDNDLHASGDRLTCLYSTDPAQIGATVTVEPRNGKAVILTVPQHGFVIFE
jgi:glycosidase